MTAPLPHMGVSEAALPPALPPGLRLLLVPVAAVVGFFAGLTVGAPVLTAVAGLGGHVASWVEFAAAGAACAAGVVLAGAVAPAPQRPLVAVLLYALGARAAYGLAPALGSTAYYALVSIVPAYLAGAAAVGVLASRRLGVVRAAGLAVAAGAVALATASTALWRAPEFGGLAYLHTRDGTVSARQFVVAPAPDLPASPGYGRGPLLLFVAPRDTARVAAAVRAGGVRVETDLGSGTGGGTLRLLTLAPARRAIIAQTLAAAWRANLVREAAAGSVPRAWARAPLPGVRLDGWGVYALGR